MKRKQQQDPKKPSPKKQNTGKAITGDHAKNAERFFALCKDLDAIKNTYNRTVPKNQSEKNYPQKVNNEPYIITHLKHMVENNTQKDKHCTSVCVGSQSLLISLGEMNFAVENVNMKTAQNCIVRFVFVTNCMTLHVNFFFLITFVVVYCE